jgi:hypothetical protein
MKNKEITMKINIDTINKIAKITILTPDKQEIKLTEKVKFKKGASIKKEIKKLLHRLKNKDIIEEIYKKYGNEEELKSKNGLTLTNKTLNIKIELTMKIKKEYKAALTTYYKTNDQQNTTSTNKEKYLINVYPKTKNRR